MNAHTPGPWRVCTTGNFGNRIEADSGKRDDLGGVPDTGYRTVAMFQNCCESSQYDDEEANRAANGRLIAAAPDLLEALEGLFRIGYETSNGRKFSLQVGTDSQWLAKARAAIAKAVQS